MVSTVEERNSLRFYQGDTEHYEVKNNDTNFDWQFYKTKGGYNLLNVLMYPNMENEYVRFIKEAKEIPYNLLDNLEEIFKIYKNIFSLMCKSSERQSEEKLHLYRVERMQAMEMVEAGHTYSLTSCSSEIISEDYFKKKDGILLLEWDVPVYVPYISVNDILEKNRYKHQKEILLPPFIQFDVEKKKFTEKELIYRDINNEPPKAKFNLNVSGISLYSDKCNVTSEELMNECRQMKNILQKFKAEGVITEKEKEYYCMWKEKFQRQIKIIFNDVYYENNLEEK